MKSKKFEYLLFAIMLLATPTSVFAISYNNELNILSLRKHLLIQPGIVLKEITNIINLNIIIVGMIIMVLILLGTIMFAPKK